MLPAVAQKPVSESINKKKAKEIAQWTRSTYLQEYLQEIHVYVLILCLKKTQQFKILARSFKVRLLKLFLLSNLFYTPRKCSTDELFLKHLRLSILFFIINFWNLCILTPFTVAKYFVTPTFIYRTL